MKIYHEEKWWAQETENHKKTELAQNNVKGPQSDTTRLQRASWLQSDTQPH